MHVTSQEKTTIVEETKSLTSHSRTMTTTEEVELLGRTFVVYPQVFHPGLFFSTAWFAERLSKLVGEASSVCEVGCGSGVETVTVALDHPLVQVTALDINPAAVENTRENVERFGLAQRVRVALSDVFDGLATSDRFDIIFWALPFGFLEPDKEVDMVDRQTFDPGYVAIEQFFAQAKSHLAHEGRLLMGFSEEIGDRALLMSLAEKYGYTLRSLVSTKGQERSSVTMEILEAVVG